MEWKRREEKRREEIIQNQKMFSEVLNVINSSTGLGLEIFPDHQPALFFSMVLKLPTLDGELPNGNSQEMIFFRGPELEILQYYNGGISILYQRAYFPAISDKEVEEIYTDISNRKVTKKFVLLVLICFLEKILNKKDPTPVLF